ncbi:MAG: hypothetical protein AAES65_11025 [Candidatus Thiodiazotropha sp. (ex. Lucinoma kazani)]|nr:hypothetical protein [Candidatus Thiodiazotropha sp. (ex Lucinoma borealis)]
MSNKLNEYYEALDRLQRGQTLNVPKGTKITKDAVALEAGRGRGSIKKSRPIFHNLIQSIQEAATTQVRPIAKAEEKVAKYRATADKYRQLWEEALARELSLIHELHELKLELSKLQSSKVTHFTK